MSLQTLIQDVTVPSFFIMDLGIEEKKEVFNPGPQRVSVELSRVQIDLPQQDLDSLPSHAFGFGSVGSRSGAVDFWRFEI